MADMVRILVTGASGAVGREVAGQLAGAVGESCVIRLATRNMTTDAAARHSAEAARLDYDDPATFAAALTGVDRLFLVTGYSVRMLAHSKLFLDAAKAAGVRHIVHLGATHEPEQPFEHLMWHAYVESYIEKLGFGFTHLQPRTFMRNVINQIRPNSTEIRHFLGATVAPWIDTADIAAVASVALLDPARHQGETYRLCGDAADMATIAAILSQETGIAFTERAMDASRLPEIYAKGGMEPIYAASLAHANQRAAADRITGFAETFDDIERVLGRPPTNWAHYARKMAPVIRARMAPEEA